MQLLQFTTQGLDGAKRRKTLGNAVVVFLQVLRHERVEQRALLFLQSLRANEKLAKRRLFLVQPLVHGG
ncbi:MAG: hypothetical protein ACC628_11950 [Pirellulaceae bacterium]